MMDEWGERERGEGRASLGDPFHTRKKEKGENIK